MIGRTITKSRPEINLKLETIEVESEIRKRRMVLHKGKLRYKRPITTKTKKEK